MNEDDLCDANKNDESKLKVSIESMKYLFKKVPEFQTVVERLVKIIDSGNTSSKCEGEHRNASGTRKTSQSDYNMKKNDKVKIGTESEREVSSGSSEVPKSCAEMEFSSETCDKSNYACSMENSLGSSDKESDHSGLTSGVKRKIDFVFSPTLVQKVKTRTNRQPSKVCKSPFTCIDHKRAPQKKAKCVTVGEIIEGLNLSDLEIAAITYVLEELAIDPKKYLVRVGAIGLCARQLKCLVRPAIEDGMDKWVDSGIIDTKVALLNSRWKNDKRAISAVSSDWLKGVGQQWLKDGLPWWKLCHQFAQELVGAELVFIPFNSSNNHWWLCVLYPAINEFQVLDSLRRQTNYEQGTRELVCRQTILPGHANFF